MPYDALFEPYHLRHLELRNRIISTPHGPAYAESGMPGERYQRYHEEKARGGIGMTMFGGSSNISVDSPSLFGQIDVSTDAVIPYFQAFSKRIHAHGAALMCQITHMGHRTVWDHGHWLPTIAPSAVRDKAHRAFPKAMEDFDIERVVADFAAAAVRCAEGGLDGCEVSLNSHLANQFLSLTTNRRTDAYGGSIENRLRFTVEVFAAIRKAVGDDYIVGVRMSADERQEHGLSPDDCIAAARLLAEIGQVDFFNVVVGNPSENTGLRIQIPGMGYGFGPHLDTVARFKQALGRPVFHATRINDAALADRAVREGMVDLVGMTRAHIADPYFIAKLARGDEARIRSCVGASYCIDRIYQGGEALCLQNAATGREQTLPQRLEADAGTPRHIVVVGAGPGGLEAARVSASRGHQVMLLEAAAEVGGQLRTAALAPCRNDLIGIVRWLENECRELGVDLRTNCYAERDDVLALQPDAVIIATGGLPNVAVCPGHEHALSCTDVLSASGVPADTVVVYDDHGDHQALSTARTLAERGATVTLVTPDRMPGEDIGLSNVDPYLRAFDELGIDVVPLCRIREIRKSGDTVEIMLRHEFSARDRTLSAGAVVVEHGVEALDELYFALKPDAWNRGETQPDELVAGTLGSGPRRGEGSFELHRIGDAIATRNVHAAIHDALRLCVQL